MGRLRVRDVRCRDDLLRQLRELRPIPHLVLDLEPLLVSWNEDLGPAVNEVRLLQEAAGAAKVTVVSNSPRPPYDFQLDGVTFIPGSHKPLRPRGLPPLGPGTVVVGDVFMTDGLLAYREGATFLHWTAQRTASPLWTRLQEWLGRPLLTLLAGVDRDEPDDRDDDGDDDGQEDRSDLQLQVLLSDYEQAREDDRYALNTQGVLLSVALGFLGVAVVALLTLCKGTTCSPTMSWFAAILPVGPLGVVVLLLTVGATATVRSFYVRALEREIQQRGGAALLARSRLRSPGLVHLLHGMNSQTHGLRSFRALSNVLLATIGAGLLGMAVLSIALIEQRYLQVGAGVAYGIGALIVFRVGFRASFGGRGLFLQLLEEQEKHYARALDDAGRPARGDAERSLLAYLGLPRPADLIKWPFVPLTFLIGALLMGGAPEASVWRDLAVVGLTLLAFEYLAYMARYQVNDIRGLADDLDDPHAAARGRLPTTAVGVHRAVTISIAVAVLRLALAWPVALALPSGPQNAVLIAIGLALALAIPYEFARGRERGQVRSPWAWFVVLWVGAGYAVRTCLGLQLGAGGRLTWPELVGAGAAAWAFGIAFVSMTWVLEGTKDLAGVVGKPHVNVLTRIAGRRRGGSPPDDPTSWRVLAGGGFGQLIAPWTLATLLSAGGFAVVFAHLVSLAPRLQAPYLTLVIATAVLAALLPWWIRLLSLPAGVVAISVWMHGQFVLLVALVPVLTYLAFSGSSLYDLEHGAANLKKAVRQKLALVGQGLVRLLVGGGTAELLSRPFKDRPEPARTPSIERSDESRLSESNRRPSHYE